MAKDTGGLHAEIGAVVIVPVEGADDPRIAAYRDLRDGAAATRDGLYIIEGEVVLRVAIGARKRLRSLLIAENRLAGLSVPLRDVPDGVPVFVAGAATLEAVAGFPVHRGVLALGERLPLPAARDVLGGLGASAVALALMGIANHDNMGGLFRNAAAFGAGAVVLDGGSCDPLYRKALRVSVGAALLVPYARLEDGEDLPALCAELGFGCLALSPRGRARLEELAPRPRTLLLLGSEGAGLPEALMANCDTVRIPMTAGFDSLNVATASGIALYHLRARA